MYSLKKAGVSCILLFCFLGRDLKAQDDLFAGYESRKQKAIAALKDFTNPDTARVDALVKVFTTAVFLKQRQELQLYCQEALALSRKLGYQKGLAASYLGIGRFYKSSLDATNARIYFDSVIYIAGRSQDQKISDLKAWADQEILQLQDEKKIQVATVEQKSTLNKVFITAITGLLVFGYLAFRTVKSEQKLAVQQQEIQKQRISELEKDRQILTVNAMLKGQDEERSRIAKDLHDGLGGMLSGVKLSFINMKENMVMPAENINGFERSIEMLDSTIAELRKVAHNLMPETLVRFGLDEALRDFCNSIQATAGLEVVYQQFGEDRKLSTQADITVYRIIQELVNNALKYSDARQIIVQLTKNHIKTGITVEDNGRGFDVKILDQKKGAGFSNIRYRVNYFKGTLDINSEPGNGTSVNIELMA